MKTKLLKKIRRKYDYNHIYGKWVFWHKDTPLFVSFPSRNLRDQLIDVVYNLFPKEKAFKITSKNKIK